jgi:hypothetical protein
MTRGKRQPWLVTTGQAWKFWLATSMAGLGLFLLALFVWCINDPNAKIFVKTGIDEVQIGAAFLFVGISAFLFLILSIRCPACKKRPVYRIMSSSGINEWLTFLITSDHCPICGYYPQE